MARRLFLFISAVLMILVSFTCLATFVAADGNRYELYGLGLESAETGEVLNSSCWALMVLALLSGLVSLFNTLISFFRNFVLQKRLIVYSSLLVLGFLVVFFVFYFAYRSRLESIASGVTIWSVAVPAVVLLLHIMAFRAINNHEAKIIAEANSFRLR